MSEPRKMTRRSFLKTAGITAGAAVLICGGVTAVGTYQPKVNFVDTLYGEETTMNKKVLVAYASRTGFTSGVAEIIGKALSENNMQVEVRQAKDVSDISMYQAVVLGSAIYMGQWMPEASKFLEKNLDALNKIPTAYFLSCATLQQDTEEKRKEVAAYLEPQRTKLKPISEGLFAGGMNYKKLSLIFSMIAKGIKVPEGDWRNESAIRTWAQELAPRLG